MNSKYSYGMYHPEHLIDLLRAGGRFPIWQTFTFPSPSDAIEIKDFIDRKFPALSEERYEIWLRFQLDSDSFKTSFLLEDIVSAHFFSDHRRNATSAGVLQTLAVYGIEIGEPLENTINPIIEEYTKNLRQQIASTVVKAWFPNIEISNKFLKQIIIGYEYQQSPAPERLPAIPSSMIWAHLIAYNPGLRKFEERPRVLLLQDIQEVLRRTDAEFKSDLKAIGDNYSSKFSDLVDQAERYEGELSKWLLQNRSTPYSYLHDLEQYLNKLADQQSFFYTSLLYLYWRTEVLNKDYYGQLSDKKDIHFFLTNASNIGMEQAVAEALFTIIYAGGPRVFQKALIEARFRILKLSELKSHEVKQGMSVEVSNRPVEKPFVPRLFHNAKKELGKLFDRLYNSITDGKKKELLENIKIICRTKGAMSKGEFDYVQYVKLCKLFSVKIEIFDDVKNKEAESDAVVPNFEIQDATTTFQENELISTNQADEPNYSSTGINPEVILADHKSSEARDRVVSSSAKTVSQNELESQIDKNQLSEIADSEEASFINVDDEKHKKQLSAKIGFELVSPDIENMQPERIEHLVTSSEEVKPEVDGVTNQVDKDPSVSTNPILNLDEKEDQNKLVIPLAKNAKKPNKTNTRVKAAIKPEINFPAERSTEDEKKGDNND